MEKVAKFIILACLFLSCEEYETSKHCIKMEISNSLPIQLWVNGEETFNEKDVCGITKVCWCQPVQSNDEIKLVVNNNGLIYLSVSSSDGEEIANILFDEAPSGVHTVIFTPGDYSVVDGEQISIRITSEPTEMFSMDNNDTTDWENDDGIGEEWRVGDYTLNSAVYKSPVMSTPIPSGTNINVSFDLFSGYSNRHLYAILSNSSNSNQQVLDFGNTLSSGVNIVNVTTSNIYNQISFYVTSNKDADVFMQINNVTISESVLTPVTLLNPSFTGSLANWNNSGGLVNWVYDAADAAKSSLVGPGSKFSSFLNQSLGVTIPIGSYVKITLTYNATGSNSGDLQARLANIGTGIEFVPAQHTMIFDGSDHIAVIEGVNTVSADKISILTYILSDPSSTILVKDITLEYSAGYAVDTSIAWDNVGNGYPWKNSLPFTLDIDNGEAISMQFFDNSTSKIATYPLPFSASNTLELTYSLSARARKNDDITSPDIEPGNPTVIVTLFFIKDDIIIDSSAMLLLTSNNVIETVIGSYIPIGGIDKIGVRAQNTGSPQFVAVDITNLTFDFSYIYAESDCLSIRESHPCTLLVTYSNATSFDGVPDSSPMTSFNLRIPAVFFEEENTTEQEDIELSDDTIVRLYDKVEEKRMLRIGFMPHYMHRKVLLALAYDFVTIDGKEWIRRDEYKKNEGDRHYPLKTAQVQLTDKNFIKENQL